MLKKNLYFACEIGSREYYARLAFGVLASSAGWQTVIGHKDMVGAYAKEFGGGFYVYKNTNDTTVPRFKQAKESGNITIAIEEEILNFTAASNTTDIMANLADRLLPHMHSEFARPYIDYYISSNRLDENFAENRVNNCRGLGNLRIAYASMYKNINLASPGIGKILVCSRTASWTSLPPYENLLILQRSHRRPLSDILTEQLKVLTEDAEFLIETDRIINELESQGKYPILRTHPAEYSNFYVEWYRLNGRLVEIDDALIPFVAWKKKICGVVATTCTTLVEAAIAGIPVYNIGRRQDEFLSDIAIEKIELNYIGDKSSMVNHELLVSELYLSSDIYLKWLEFLEGFEARSSEKLPMPASNLKISGYAARRAGHFDPKQIEVDVNLACGIYKLQAPTIRATRELLIVSPQ